MKGRLFVMLIISICIQGCKYNPFLRKRLRVEYQKVDECRSKWKYASLPQKTTLTILLHNEKGRHSLVSWPNLFIGIDSKGDTIGVLDYKTELEYKVGEQLTFLPLPKEDSLFYVSIGLMGSPLFVVHKRSSENDLYCSVDLIYDGKLEK